jgi:hypothetical protein
LRQVSSKSSGLQVQLAFVKPRLLLLLLLLLLPQQRLLPFTHPSTPCLAASP